ncbi:hypothetical protein T261_5100 [Streptomyces lydicus]|nr:hypothetical protein T261_5100 [Streptomyces lydicus]
MSAEASDLATFTSSSPKDKISIPPFSGWLQIPPSARMTTSEAKRPPSPHNRT